MTSRATVIGPARSLAEQFVSAIAAPSPVVVQLGQGATSALTINELEHAIGADPEFSLRVLSLANSAFYSQQHEVQSLRSALVVLGADAVRRLAAGMLARAILSSADSTPLTYDLWRHSQAVATAAQMLAEIHRQVEPAQAFAAGLLHDIGILAICRLAPGGCSDLPISAARNRELAGDSEHPLLGVNHAELGGEIADMLGLSPSLSQAIRRHDDTVISAPEDRPLVATVCTANQLALRCGYTHELDASDNVDPDQSAIRALRLREADVDTMATQLPRRIEQVRGIMQIAEGDEP